MQVASTKMSGPQYFFAAAGTDSPCLYVSAAASTGSVGTARYRFDCGPIESGRVDSVAVAGAVGSAREEIGEETVRKSWGSTASRRVVSGKRREQENDAASFHGRDGNAIQQMAAEVTSDHGDAAAGGWRIGDERGAGCGLQHDERVHFDVSEGIGDYAWPVFGCESIGQRSVFRWAGNQEVDPTNAQDSVSPRRLFSAGRIDDQRFERGVAAAESPGGSLINHGRIIIRV